MSTWGEQRKNTIIGVLTLLILIPIVFAVYSYLNKPQTCTDGKQNQDERGVDCGGVCSLVCRADALNLIVSWQRLFKVADGVYTAVAYIENPNVGAGAKNVPYVFKVYGDEGVVVYERKGVAQIYPKHGFAIVEPVIESGQRSISRMTFEFTAEPTWIKASQQEVPLRVTNRIVTREDSAPRIEALLENPSINLYRNLGVIALVYGKDGNAMAASRTVVERIGKDEKVPVIFTWPEPFPSPITRIEIMPEL